MVGVTNAIPEHSEDYEIHRLISTLLSSELREQQKLDIIEKEYKIPVNSEFREEVKCMCNLGEGIEERAAEKATEIATEKMTEKMTEKFVMGIYERGIPIELIADVAGMNVADISAIIKEKEPVLV